MYSTIINFHGKEIASNYFKTYKEAKKHAAKYAGIIAILDPDFNELWRKA